MRWGAAFRWSWVAGAVDDLLFRSVRIVIVEKAAGSASRRTSSAREPSALRVCAIGAVRMQGGDREEAQGAELKACYADHGLNGRRPIA